jgi:hypothetical protein
MLILTLLESIKPHVDRGDFFVSRFGLGVALIITVLLVGILLIVIVRRVIGVYAKLESQRADKSRWAVSPDKPAAADKDPWSESAKRIKVEAPPESAEGDEEPGPKH